MTKFAQPDARVIAIGIEYVDDTFVDIIEVKLCWNENGMGKKGKVKRRELIAEKSELAMIEGILEGSPDGIGIVVVRLDCGCRKMAAVAKDGEPASKVIIYRDNAETVCEKCQDDDGAFMRVTSSFIHWVEPEPSDKEKEAIELKVLGSRPH